MNSSFGVKACPPILLPEQCLPTVEVLLIQGAARRTVFGRIMSPAGSPFGFALDRGSCPSI